VIRDWLARLGRGVIETWEVFCWHAGWHLRQAWWALRAAPAKALAWPARRLWWPLADRLEGWWLGPRGPRALRAWLGERHPLQDTALLWFLLSTRVQGWLRGRNPRYLLGSAPVLVFSVAAGFLLLWGTALTPEQLASRYRARARYAALVRNHAGARVCYERLADLGEAQAEHHFQLALALDALGQPAQAAALLGRLTAPAGAAYAPALLHLAKQRLNAPTPFPQDLRTAEQHLTRVLRETAPVGKASAVREERLERLRQADPVFLARLEALMLLGKRHLEAGRTAAGEKCLLDAVAEATPDGAAEPHVVFGPETALVAEAHRLLGKLYVRQGDLPAAELHLLAAANHLPPDDPGRIEVQALLARAYLASDLPDEAEPCLLRALEANQPNHPATVEAHALMAQRYAKAQRYQEAEDELRQVLNAPVPVPELTAKAQALLGQVYLNTGRVEQAEFQLRQVLRVPYLEPETAAGVHVLLGRICLAGRRYPEAETYLLKALEVKLPDLEATTEAHALIGQLYEVTRRPDKAEEHLKQGAEKRPELGLSLGRLLLARGSRVDGRHQLGRALRAFQRQAEADPADVQSRLNWAEAALLRDEPAVAVQALLPALTVDQVRPAAAVFWGDRGLGAVVLQQYWAAPRARACGPALATAALRWLAALEASPKADLVQRLEALDLALRHDPGQMAVLTRLLAAAKLRGVEADKRRGLLERARRERKAPVLVGVVSALDDLAQGDRAAGEKKLRDVLRSAPQVGQALNNLAFLLAETTPAQRPQALALIDAAVEAAPTQPHYRDTRGQILAHLGRWEAARVDLEAALPGLANKDGTRRTLALAYDHLGQPDKAAEQRRLLSKPER
jgi:tetratricopeptide (TPR) repeat protein